MQNALMQDDLIAKMLQPGVDASDAVATSLEVVRAHLDADVAYFSEFLGDDVVVQAVAAPGFADEIAIGARLPRDATYSGLVAAGHIPQIVIDTAKVPLCEGDALTQSLPVRAVMCAPVDGADGAPLGMFCCLSRTPRPDFNGRDIAILQGIAGRCGSRISAQRSVSQSLLGLRDMISAIIRDEAFDIVYQPIKTANGHIIKGFEALCRFRMQPYRAPNQWFDDAAKVGLRLELEVAVIRKVLNALHSLDDETFISLNVSPNTVSSGKLAKALAGWPCPRIVLEITENSTATDYEMLVIEVARLRQMGALIAIDDAGGGHSGLQHIVKMNPDIIKLDISLTASIDTDIVRRSIAASLVNFATEIDAMIVAEGVETQAELDALAVLGVPLAQGHFLARPAPLKTFLGRGVPVA